MGPPFLIYYLAIVLKWKHGVTLIETLKYIHIFCTRSYLYRDKVGFDFNQIISALWDREGEGLLLVNQHFIDIIFRCTHCNSVFCLTPRIIHTVKNDVTISCPDNLSSLLAHFIFPFNKSCWIDIPPFVKPRIINNWGLSMKDEKLLLKYNMYINLQMIWRVRRRRVDQFFVSFDSINHARQYDICLRCLNLYTWKPIYQTYLCITKQ